jgi:hypothetical protein
LKSPEVKKIMGAIFGNFCGDHQGEKKLTCITTSFNFVRNLVGGNLYAVAHRGHFPVAPNLFCKGMEFTLMTMPSMSYFKLGRSFSHFPRNFTKFS